MIADLLQVAQRLAESEPGPAQQASLRRAVSTAYYALFHAVLENCAKALINADIANWETYSLLYRAPDHATVKKVLEAAQYDKLLKDIARDVSAPFVKLQKARIDADYDPGPLKQGSAEVLDLIEQARTAALNLSNVPKVQILRLAALLIAKRR